MRDFHIPLFAGEAYHVLNRGHGDEKLFREEENYRFFLQKFRQYVSPIAQTLAWCLMPNHYHFLIRIKPLIVLKERHLALKGKVLKEEQVSKFIMQQFSIWQNSYAKALNKVYGRKGGLFTDYMRRIKMESEKQMANTVFYIHNNPVHYGFVRNMEAWQHSSYKEYASDKFTIVDSNEMVVWFGSRENFIQFHKKIYEVSKTS